MSGTDAVLKTTALGKGQTVVSEEELREKHVNRTGENIELLQLGTDSQISPDGRREIIGAGTRKRGMVLPFTPLSITFDNIKYSVDMPQVSINQKKCLIFNTETGTTK